MTTPRTNEQSPSHVEKILVVDDDGECLERTCRSLTRAGFSAVMSANDLPTAERLALENQLRLALIDLDLGVPRQDGIACMKAIRAASPFTVPVILSGERSPHHFFRAAREGAVDYVVKGPSLDLPNEVTRILTGARGAASERPLPRVRSDVGYLRHFGLTQREIGSVAGLVRDTEAGTSSSNEPPPTARMWELTCAKLGVATTQQLLRALAICELFREENESTAL